jgi:hypothetical protein
VRVARLHCSGHTVPSDSARVLKASESKGETSEKRIETVAQQQGSGGHANLAPKESVIFDNVVRVCSADSCVSRSRKKCVSAQPTIGKVHCCNAVLCRLDQCRIDSLVQ